MQKKDIFFENKGIFFAKKSISSIFTYFCTHETAY